MSTVDIAEVRRTLERHVVLGAAGNHIEALYLADRLLAYLPLLLDELEQLRRVDREAQP